MAQLRHVLAAGQSAQMAQEDEQGRVPVAPGGVCQRDRLPIMGSQREVRRSITNL
jgi:hypothetical protein